MIDHKLRLIANRQWGYFTARQAVAAGYSKDLQRYHAKCGNWMKVARALFRLPGYSDCIESNLVCWSLWAEGQSENRLVVVSHCTALHYYGLQTLEPQVIDLTVSGLRENFQNPRCRLHPDLLHAGEYQRREGFLITTALRTLQDLRPDLTYNNRWVQTVQLALARGLIDDGDVRERCGLSASAVADVLPQRPHTPQSMLVAGGTRSATGGMGMGDMDRTITVGGRGGSGGWRAPHRSFTLVEMLVVVAIISILAMLLMPALTSALNSARMQSCINNQRQTMLQMQVYFNDFNDKIVVVDTNGPIVHKYEQWAMRLYQVALLDETNERIFSCPGTDAPVNTLTDYTNDYVYSNNYIGMHYGHNVGITSWRAPEDKMFSAKAVKSPSTFVFILDGKKSGSNRNGSKFWKNAVVSSLTWSATPWTAHNQGLAVTAAYLDGHVASESCAKLLQVVDPALDFVSDARASW